MRYLSLLASAAALALVGCAVLPVATTPINQSEVYAVENAYGIAQSAAVAYTVLPPCPAGVHTDATHLCREQRIVRALADADAKVRAVRGPLEAFVRNPKNYPNLDYAVLIQQFRAAVDNLRAVESANGVK